MLHVRRRNAFTSLPFGGKLSLLYQCWSVSPVLNALYLQRHTLFRCFIVHIFSCAAPAFRQLLSQHFQCCTWSLLPETECRHLSWSFDQPSCLLFASKCSNSEPAGPGQNACPSSSAVASSKRITISFSRYYLVTRPFTGAINCLQSWRRHRSSSSSWHPWRRSVQPRGWASTHRADPAGVSATNVCCCPSASITPPKQLKKTSENWKRLSYNKPLQAGRWTVVRSGWPSNAVRVAIFFPSLSPATEHAKLVYS